jgi:hypothetical protein
MGEAEHVHVDLVGEDDVAPPGHPAIAIIEAVDRGVVLVVAADRGQQQRARLRFFGVRVDEELRLAARRVPDPVARADGQAEAAGRTRVR